MTRMTITETTSDESLKNALCVGKFLQHKIYFQRADSAQICKLGFGDVKFCLNRIGWFIDKRAEQFWSRLFETNCLSLLVKYLHTHTHTHTNNELRLTHTWRDQGTHMDEETIREYIFGISRDTHSDSTNVVTMLLSTAALCCESID